MINLSKTNNEHKIIESKEATNKISSQKNNIRLTKPKYSLKIDFDSKRNKFIKRYNSLQFNNSTKNALLSINPVKTKLPPINIPSISILSRQNKNISFIDYQENNIKNLSLSLEKEAIEKKNTVNNFVYNNNNQIKALELKLHKDSIEEQEKEYQKRKEEEINRKKKEICIKINKNIIEPKKINDGSKNIEKKNNINIESKNIDDKMLFNNELNITLRQMNILSNEANLAFNKYKLRINNILNSYNNIPNFHLNKNRFKIKKAKLFSLSPIGKNGLNVLKKFKI